MAKKNPLIIENGAIREVRSDEVVIKKPCYLAIPENPPIDATGVAFHSSDSDSVFISNSTTVWKRARNGCWTKETQTFVGIKMFTQCGSLLLIGQTDNKIYTRNWAGTYVLETTPVAYLNCYCSDGTDVYIGGNAGVYYKRTSAGVWSSVQTSIVANIQKISTTSTGVLLYCSDGVLYHVTWAGVVTVQVTPFTVTNLQEMVYYNGITYFIVSVTDVVKIYARDSAGVYSVAYQDEVSGYGVTLTNLRDGFAATFVCSNVVFTYVLRSGQFYRVFYPDYSNAAVRVIFLGYSIFACSVAGDFRYYRLCRYNLEV